MWGNFYEKREEHKMFEKTLAKQDHRRVWFKEYNLFLSDGAVYPKYTFADFQNRQNEFAKFQVKLITDPEYAGTWIIHMEALLGAKLEDMTYSAEYIMTHFSSFVRDLSDRLDLTDAEFDSVSRNRIEFEFEGITVLVTRECYQHKMLEGVYEKKKRQMKMA